MPDMIRCLKNKEELLEGSHGKKKRNHSKRQRKQKSAEENKIRRVIYLDLERTIFI